MNFVYIVFNILFLHVLGMGMIGLISSPLISRVIRMLFAVYTLRINRGLFILKKEDLCIFA